MSEGPEWFAQKRYGYGAGLPIAWQGWALLAAFMAIVVAAGVSLEDKPLALAAVVMPALFLLILISARTTRGGWRWRWGRDD